MEGHSRGGAFRDGARGNLNDSGDFFGRMKNDWGRDADMFFEQDRDPDWGFSHGGMPMGVDPEMEAMRGRARPKFHSFDAMRPGMFGPRPFQRERRSSGEPAGPAGSPTAAAADQADAGPTRERIIPIQIERDEADAAAAPAEASPRPQKRYARRGTADSSAMKLAAEEAQRDARAKSCPPEAEAAAERRPPPLDVAGARQAQRDDAQPPRPGPSQKPNYFNSSPKPFSPEPRPFQRPSFGRAWPAAGEPMPIPVHVERPGGGRPAPAAAKVPPKVAPKPRPAAQPQPQPEPSQPQAPRPPPPKPKTPKERAMERIEGVQNEVAQLSDQVDTFAGQKGGKQYLYLDEMLTRELIKLDDVEAGGDDEIRTSRKDAIMRIQRCLSQLEKRATAGAEGEAETEAPMEAEPAAEAPMEAEPAAVEAPAAAAEASKEAPATAAEKTEEGEAPMETAEAADAAPQPAPADVAASAPAPEQEQEQKQEEPAPAPAAEAPPAEAPAATEPAAAGADQPAPEAAAAAPAAPAETMDQS